MMQDFLIPSERNRGIPHLLSRPGFVLYLVLALGLIFSPSYLRFRELASLADPLIYGARDMFQLLNQSRTAAGLATLKESIKLDQAAEKKIDDMFSKQYFAHFSPQNKSPWDFLREGGYSYLAAGENLAIDFVTAGEAHSALMSSPTHRANILSPLYTEVGVAVKQGTFEGRPGILIAQYFGKPRAQSLVPVAGAAPAPRPTPAPLPKNTTATPAAKPVSKAPAPESALANEHVKNAVSGNEVTSANLATELTPQMGLRTLSILAIVSLLLPLLFLITRTGSASWGALFRVFILIGLFSYAAVSGTTPLTASKITPASASIIEVAAP